MGRQILNTTAVFSRCFTVIRLGNTRLFIGIIIAIFLTGTVFCAKSPIKIEKSETRRTISIGTIEFCGDERCSKKAGCTVNVNEGKILVYLDLRNKKDLQLITNIKTKLFSDLKIRLKTENGKEIGAIDLNYRVTETKSVNEEYFDEVPIMLNGKVVGKKVIKREGKKKFQEKVVERECTDGEIIPQVINIHPGIKMKGKKLCFLYLTFNINYTTADLNEKSKDTVSARIEDTTIQNICSSPFPVYINWPEKGKADEFTPAEDEGSLQIEE